MKPAEFADLFDACREGREWAVSNCATMDDAWATARPDWLVWIATRRGVLDDRTLRRFAVWSARQVQHLMTDPRSLAALDVAERHADGQATDEELAAAWDAALAADAAAWAAARAAARAAAWAAAWAAAGATWDAARDVAWAARAAAEASARYAADAAARAAARAAQAAGAATGAAQAAWLRENATPDWARAREMGGAR
jgi:hypothetical protein